MKALLFIPQLDRGGPDRVFAALAASLPQHGVETSTLVQVEGGDYWASLPAQVDKAVLPNSTAGTGAVKAYPVRAFADHVRRSRPDVVLCTLRSHFTASAAALTRQLKVPLVIRPANHLTRNSMELLRRSPLKHGLSWLAGIASLHVADHVICQSADLYEDFRRYGVPKARLTVIGNPIALPETEGIRSRLQHRPGQPSLVAVGRLMPQKGFDVLIEAVGLLKARLPNLRLTIFGEGPDRSTLDEQIRRLELTEHVVLAGFTSGVEEPVATADFLVSSSRYEGFPNVVLEALSLGTPVIATNCPGGTGELVIDGKTGWLCAPESAQALAEVIVRAARSERPSSDSLRQFVEERYSTDRVVSAYADVLRRAARLH